jgi:hypothetical protein
MKFYHVKTIRGKGHKFGSLVWEDLPGMAPVQRDRPRAVCPDNRPTGDQGQQKQVADDYVKLTPIVTVGTGADKKHNLKVTGARFLVGKQNFEEKTRFCNLELSNYTSVRRQGEDDIRKPTR